LRVRGEVRSQNPTRDTSEVKAILSIQLLGPPSVRIGGVDAPPPRDRKTWGALAYLLLNEAPPPRTRLAELMFPEVDDPLAAVRWVLAGMRRLLGGLVVVEGDPIHLQRPAGMVLDTDMLGDARWSEAVALPTLDRELLEGISFDALAAFDLWLTGERRRLKAASAAILHEATLSSLASDARRAVGFAERLVALDPFDEGHHVVLVRSLMATGRTDEATRRVDACVSLFKEELDRVPTGALRDALATRPQATRRDATLTAVNAQLQAAEAAVAAGSWMSGIDLFRRAVAGSRALEDQAAHARALVGLGSALVHAARGQDEEGAASLHEGGELAQRIGKSAVAVTAWRELAWVEFLRARYDRVWLWLDRAASEPECGPLDKAWISLISGATRTDTSEYSAAIRDLTEAVEIADRDQLLAPAALARSFLGRLHLLLGDLQLAESFLNRSIDDARKAAWTSFLPWPESLLAEVELRKGNLAVAEEMFGHALAMARELGDPCWESISARGLGLTTVLKGDLDTGLNLLEEAPRLCRRLPDSYLWVEAYAMEALCAVALEHGSPSAGRWIESLEELSERAGFRELSIRALLYRSRLGDRKALDAARIAAEGIHNPRLTQELEKADLPVR